MRRLILAAAIFAVAAAGCNRNKRERVKVELTDESSSQIASIVHVADPRASVQLIKGFHDVEQNAWRWTMGKFSVTLRPPKGAAERGAALQLKFSVPDAVLEKLKTVTLTANVNGTAIPGETYSKAGDYTYARDVPATALNAEAVTVNFALDKFLTPGSVDQRELGIVVASIGLEAK